MVARAKALAEWEHPALVPAIDVDSRRALELRKRALLRRGRRKGSAGSHIRIVTQHRALWAHMAPDGRWCPGAYEMGHGPHRLAPNERLTVDHIIPASAGGSNRRDNKRVLCSTVNAEKADAVPEGHRLRQARSTSVPNMVALWPNATP